MVGFNADDVTLLLTPLTKPKYFSHPIWSQTRTPPLRLVAWTAADASSIVSNVKTAWATKRTSPWHDIIPAYADLVLKKIRLHSRFPEIEGNYRYPWGLKKPAGAFLCRVCACVCPRARVCLDWLID